MSTKVHVQAKAPPSSSFTPAPSGLLQRKCACGGKPGLDGECAECRQKRFTVQPILTGQPAPTATSASFGHDFGRVRVNEDAPQIIQTKLRVNEPGDRFEQEADRVADQVMRMPEPEGSKTRGLPRIPSRFGEPRIQRLCSECMEKLERGEELNCPECEEELRRKPIEGEEAIQAKEVTGNTPEVSPALGRRIHALRGGGQPLDPNTRTFMEPRFGHDFSQVRIHTGPPATESARAVNARAYTLGHDVVFGSGQFDPGSREGQRLLAHELTHVIQQDKASPTRNVMPSDPVVQRVSVPAAVSAPAGPSCPKVPAATPGTCAARNTGYCDAKDCFPGNPWLRCACTVSWQICEAVDAFLFRSVQGGLLAVCVSSFRPLGVLTVPLGRILGKGLWFLSTNKCIWEHWRAALDALHDPSRNVPSGLTSEWASAVSICQNKGVTSTDCCKAQVKAEQHAIEDCGTYDSTKYGRLPTDIPGAPVCSVFAARIALGPAFTGDFGIVNDRIAYGDTLCCS